MEDLWELPPFAHMETYGRPLVPKTWQEADYLWIFGRGTINPQGDFCRVRNSVILYVEPSGFTPRELKKYPFEYLDDFVAMGL